MAEIIQLPGRLNLTFNKNNSFSRTLTVKDKATGLPINLTGYTFYTELYNLDKTVSYNFTVTNTDLANGQITISLLVDITNLLTENTEYEWYIDFISGQDRRTYASGKVIIREGV